MGGSTLAGAIVGAPVAWLCLTFFLERIAAHHGERRPGFRDIGPWWMRSGAADKPEQGGVPLSVTFGVLRRAGTTGLLLSVSLYVTGFARNRRGRSRDD